MKTTRSTTIGVLAFLALIFGAVSVEAQSKSFRIRHVATQGDLLMVYHNPVKVAADAKAAVTIGGNRCDPVEGETRKAARDTDNLALLLVIDRGGNSRTGMAPHNNDIVRGIESFTKQHLREHGEDLFALAETPGEGRAGEELTATKSANEISNWLRNLGPSAGPGADIYGTTKNALQLLADVDTSFRGVIIISDGLDPHSREGTGGHHGSLIDAANDRGIPISTLHVDRSEEVTPRKRGRMQEGRGLLNDVATRTHGEFKSISVNDQLALEVHNGLKDLESRISNVERTLCTICGTGYNTEKSSRIEIRLEKEGTILAQSRRGPTANILLDKADYKACPEEAKACESDDDCDSCATCSDKECSNTCENDEDCPEGCACEDGSCAKVEEVVEEEEEEEEESEAEDKGMSKKNKILIAVGGTILLGIVLLLIGLSRRASKRRETALQQAEEERGKAAKTAKAALKQSEDRHQEELDRQQRETNEIQKQVDTQKSEMAAIEDQMHPILYRLVSADGTIDLPLRVGNHMVGSDPSCDMVFQLPTVSGTHAQITVTAEGAVGIDDLQSSNGTFVNGYRIEAGRPVELRVGDILGLSKALELQIAPVDRSPSGPPASGGPQRGKTMLEE